VLVETLILNNFEQYSTVLSAKSTKLGFLAQLNWKKIQPTQTMEKAVVPNRPQASSYHLF